MHKEDFNIVKPRLMLAFTLVKMINMSESEGEDDFIVDNETNESVKRLESLRRLNFNIGFTS